MNFNNFYNDPELVSKIESRSDSLEQKLIALNEIKNKLIDGQTWSDLGSLEHVDKVLGEILEGFKNLQ